MSVPAMRAANAADTMAVVPGQNDRGAAIFSVLAKRTYVIRPGQRAMLADRPNPLTRVDVYYEQGGPESATVQYETDLAPFKLATDVVFIGKAHAKVGEPVTQLDVCLEVGAHRKSIRVIGDRYCRFREGRDPLLTDPIPFEEMEIRYERAYGGKDDRSQPELPFYYPRNTMGTGVALHNKREAVEGLALPNLEDPEDLLSAERLILGDPGRWSRQPLPQGLGWFQRTWFPRCSYVGSVPGDIRVDETLREEQLGLVPAKQVERARRFQLPAFDVRFNNGASSRLAVPFLAGSETARLTNLTPEGEWEFTLPGDTPLMSLDLGAGAQELSVVLHTVQIRGADRQVDLVWRGALEYPGTDWLPQMKRLRPRVKFQWL